MDKLPVPRVPIKRPPSRLPRSPQILLWAALPVLWLTALPCSRAEDLPLPALSGPEWPLYQGDSGFAGVSPDAAIKPPFRLAWSYRLDGDASGDAGAGVTVGGGLVYVNVLNTRSLLALTADTGQLRWSYSASYLGYRTVPSYAQGRLFLWERGEPQKPRVLALDAATGKVLWSYALKPDHGTNVRAGLPVAGGMVYCSEGGAEPRVTALDVKSGQPVWSVSLGSQDGNEISPPSVANGRVFVATRTAANRRGEAAAQAGAVVALAANSGKELWRQQAYRPSVRPIFTDGRVLGVSFFDKAARMYEFRLLQADKGQTLWTFAKKFSVYNPPAATIGKDVILIKPYGGSFYVVDRKTGRQRAHFKDRTNSGCGTPVLAGGYAYVGTGVFAGDLEAIKTFQWVDAPRTNGRCAALHVVDVKTGKSVWFRGAGNTVCGDPALAYGRLYFTSRDGRVYCFVPVPADKAAAPAALDQAAPADPRRLQALLAETSAQPPAPGTTWPMFGGNAERTGTDLPAMKLPLQPAWKVRLGDRIGCSAAIATNKVFIGSDAGSLVALEAEHGTKLWEFSTGAPIRCSPAVAGGFVYCGSDNGRFYAIASDSGREKWRFLCGGAVQASPAIVGDVVIFAANDHHVYALDRRTGAKLWTARLEDFLIQAAPVVCGGQVFVGQWHDWVCALDVHTGRRQWRTFIPISIEALACYRNKLYVRAPNYLVEIDPQTGKRLRLCQVPYGYGGVAFLGNCAFLSGVRSQYGSPGREVIDLSQPGVPLRPKIPTLEDARLLRATALKGAADLAAMTAPLALGKTLCYASREGRLFIVAPDGTRLWTADLGGTCHSAPAAILGLLVVGCDDGCVYGFRSQTPPDR